MADRRKLARILWGLSAALLAACGTGATSPDSCRRIEEARCRRAPGCAIPLAPPYTTTGTDVDACIRFYDVACLHGLDVSYPGSADVSNCVTAIETGACSVVKTPETDRACIWLINPANAAAVDASSDAASTSASMPADGASD